ncbi:MAG: response regulator transcription factor [Caldilineaceae bacterium]
MLDGHNMEQKRILVVDDEAPLRKTIQAYLLQEGYEVQGAEDGPTALKLFSTFQPHLIILDILLPGINGLELLQQLRRQSDVYVILLTAKADETDKIVGLRVGADDYVTKPFSPRELVARAQAILRRQRTTEQTNPMLTFDRLHIDPAARQVWKDAALVELTPIEYELLYTLAQHPKRVLSREQLIEQVWGYDYYGDDRVIDVHIRRLRNKIEDDGANPRYITTVRGAGYRFDGALR